MPPEQGKPVSSHPQIPDASGTASILPGTQSTPSFGLPPGVPAAAFIAQMTATMSRYTSPFPPPDVLEGYKNIDPDLCNKVLEAVLAEGMHRRKMEEDEASHRRNLEEKETEAKISDAQSGQSYCRWGQFYAFLICTGVISTGTYLVSSGNPISGTIIGSGGAVIALVGAFLKPMTNTTAVAKPTSRENATPVPPLTPSASQSRTTPAPAEPSPAPKKNDKRKKS